MRWLSWREVTVAEVEIPDDPHFIRRNGGWFRPNAQGYTTRVVEAGLFSGEVARAYLRDCDGISIHRMTSVQIDLAEEIIQARQALARCEAAYARASGGAPFNRSNVVKLVTPALLAQADGGEHAE